MSPPSPWRASRRPTTPAGVRVYASTAQINPEVYREHFEAILRNGKDVLYLCFSSGLSGTIQSARMAIAGLREEYPDRTILCLDTLCAAVGEGLFVMEAARFPDAEIHIAPIGPVIGAHAAPES